MPTLLKTTRNWQFLIWLAVFVALIAIPLAGASSRWIQLLALIGINTLLAQSMNIVGGYAGQISLGHAGIFAAGAYGSAVLATKLGWPIWITIPGGIVIAMIVGLIVALPAERVKEFYLGMVTLGFGVVAFEILQYWTPVTGGFMGISDIPSPTLRNLTILGHRVTLVDYYYAVLVLVALFTLLKANLIQSHIGRAFVAVDGSELVASSLGIRPGRTKHLAYVASAAWAGLAGGLYAHLIAYISPDSFNLWVSVSILVMAVFGGFRTFSGPFLGAAFFTLLPEFTQDLKDYQLLAYGLILMGSYVLLPRGIAGLWNARTAYTRHARKIGSTLLAAVAAPALKPASIDVRGLSKQFGGLRALDDVDIKVRPGSIHGLLGPNGSGKSTLVNLVTGVFQPTAGQILYADHRIDRLPPYVIVRHGIVRTFQNPQIFGDMTVRENVLTATHRQFRAGVFSCLVGANSSEEAQAATRVDAILERVGLADDSETLAAGLSYGKKRLLDLARCLATQPDVLILDEPAAGLSENELDHLAGLIRELHAQGMTILLIEHHLDFLFNLVEAVTVLDYGKVIFDGKPAEARRDKRVIEAYLGDYGVA